MAKTKLKSEKRNPRVVKRGDVVRVKSSDGVWVEDVVRSITVVVNLANGMTYPVEVTEDIEVITETDLPDEILSQIATLQGEGHR